MKIVLLENVDFVGIVGDIKEVTDGYARNYLLPKKLAVKAGDPSAKKLLKNIAKKRQEAKKTILSLEKIAKELDGKTIEFMVQTNEKGKLFAAITANDIADKLEIDKKQIQCAPIKDTGAHKIKIYFSHGIKANISVIINSKLKKENKSKKEV